MARESSIRKHAMLVSARLGRPKRKVTQDEATRLVHDKYRSAPKSGSFHTNLYDEADLRPILRIYEQWYTHSHKLLTRPWEHGVAIISKKGIPEWERRCNVARQEFDDAARKASDRFPQILDNARRQNADLFPLIENLYPDAQGFYESFSFNPVVRPVPVADDLRVSLGERGVEEARKQLQELHAEGLRDVYARLQQKVGHLSKSFTDYTKGKRLGESVITNVTDIVAALDCLNIPDAEGNIDAELEAIGTEISTKLIATTDLETIKTNPVARAKAAKVAADLSDKLAGYF